MNIDIRRINEKLHFRAVNSQGNSIDIDASPAAGGENKGFRPMETALAALASCAVMDVIQIIEKQRMHLEDIRIEVKGNRINAVPSPFGKIHINFILKGTLDQKKVAQAVKLGVEKHCSVAAMFGKSTSITHSFAIE